MMKKPKQNPVQRDLLEKMNRLARRLSAKKLEDFSRTDLVDVFYCLSSVCAEVRNESNPFVLEKFLKVTARINQLVQDKRDACINKLLENDHDPEFMRKVLGGRYERLH